MKKKNTIVAGIIMSGGVLALLLFSSGTVKKQYEKFHQERQLNSTGPPSGKTGAPGEGNCTDCHTGNTQDGNNGINELTLSGGGTTFNPGSTQTVTLELTDTGVRNGFQVVALDQNDDMAGSFTITDATNTQMISGLGRTYVTHEQAGTQLSSWSFDWDAPATAEEVTFYVATNKADGANGNSGDVIYLSNHVFTNPSAHLEDEQFNQENEMFTAGYVVDAHAVTLRYSMQEPAKVAFNLINLQGRSMHYEVIGNFEGGQYTENVKLPEFIEDGIYAVTLFINNTTYTKKVLVQH